MAKAMQYPQNDTVAIESLRLTEKHVRKSINL
jgi:hypothetical protein